MWAEGILRLGIGELSALKLERVDRYCPPSLKFLDIFRTYIELGGICSRELLLKIAY